MYADILSSDLPDETKEMMLQTAQAAYDLGVDSLKYHSLYVVKRTALANEYARGEFTPISEELYLEVLSQASGNEASPYQCSAS